MPEPARGVVHGYLDRLDRTLPFALAGFYVVGSIALGAFRAGRSDIDFVATVDGPLADDTLAALRRVHRVAYVEGLARAVAARSWPLICNGVFVDSSDLARAPSPHLAVASQVAERFAIGRGFDVNPITWWTLAHAGIPLQGPEPSEVSVHLDDAALRRWTAANLAFYWRPWADTVGGRGPAAWAGRLRQLHARRLAAWGVLGTARMHATIATGTVVSKEAAGTYALDAFGAQWHPIVSDALAYWQQRPPAQDRPASVLRAETAAFVRHVVDLVGADGDQ